MNKNFKIEVELSKIKCNQSQEFSKDEFYLVGACTVVDKKDDPDNPKIDKQVVYPSPILTDVYSINTGDTKIVNTTIFKEDNLITDNNHSVGICLEAWEQDNGKIYNKLANEYSKAFKENWDDKDYPIVSTSGLGAVAITTFIIGALIGGVLYDVVKGAITKITTFWDDDDFLGNDFLECELIDLPLGRSEQVLKYKRHKTFGSDWSYEVYLNINKIQI